MDSSISEHRSIRTPQRVRRWALRGVAAVLMVLGAAWLIQMLFLPWLVGRQLSAALNRLGLTNATFHVRQASIWGAEIEDLQAGEGKEIVVNRVTVTFSPWQVIRGHLHSIAIAGAEIQVAVGGNKTMPTAGGGQGGGSTNTLPFEKIEVQSSTLKVDWQDRHFLLPVDGTLDVADDGQMTLAANTFFRGVGVPISGKFSQGFKQFELQCNADDIGAGGLVSALPQSWTHSIPAMSGTIKLSASVHKSEKDLGGDLSINGANATIHAGSATLQGPSALLHLAATSDAHGITISATNGSTFSLTSADFGSGQAGPVKFTVADGPLMVIENPASGSAIRVNAKLQTLAAVSATAVGATISAGSIGLVTTIETHADKATVDGVVTLGGVSLVDPDSKLEVTGAAGTIPIAWNSKPSAPGKITVQAVTLDGTVLPSPSLTAQFVDGRLDAVALWAPLQGAALTATAAVWRGPAGMQSQLTASAPKFVISDPTAWRTIVKSRGDMDITGTFTLDAKATFSAGKFRPQVRVQVQNGAISSKQYDFSVEGLAGDVALRRLWPVATPGSQVVKAKNARIGKMSMADGTLQFRVENPHSILIEQTNWAWAGGQIYTHALQLDPAKPDMDVALFAENLSVGELLKFALTEDQVGGEGRLYGRMPAKIHWPTIEFGDGYLYSAPGNGQLSLGSKSQTVADMVAGNDAANNNSVKDQLRGQLVQALQHFQYDLLKVDFVNKDGGLTASVHVKGRGQTQGTPQNLDITFNFNGVDQAFRNVLVIKRLLQSISK